MKSDETKTFFGELSTNLLAGMHQMCFTNFYNYVTLMFPYYVSLVESKQRPKIGVVCEG